jgi:hypothetical protein
VLSRCAALAVLEAWERPHVTLSQALTALVVPNESAVTAGLGRKAWIRGYPSPLEEYQRRVRSWGLRRKRERVWRRFLTGGVEKGEVFIGVPS